MIESILMNYSLGIIFISIVAILAGYFLPFFGQYRVAVQFVGIVLLSYMLFLSGKDSERDVWEEKMSEAKVEMANLRAASEKVNTQTIIKYVDKIKYVDRIKTQVVTEFITKENDAACTVNGGFVNLHDSIVKGVPAEPKETDSQPSAVKLSEIAETVKINYSNFLLNSEKLEALQGWIRDQKELRK